MDRVIAPTNLFSWPKVKKLIPDHKLIVQTLWQNPAVQASGAYFLDIDIFAAYLGFDSVVIEQAIKDLAEKDLVVFDWETSEIFILDWWRFHKCANAVQEKMVQVAVDKVQSIHIRKAFFFKIKHVSNKINDLHSNYNSNSNSNSNSNNNYNKEPSSDDDGSFDDGSSGGCLKFPRSVKPEFYSDIEKLLIGNPQSTEILDELAARLESKTLPKVGSPVHYLSGMLSKPLVRTPAGLAKTKHRLDLKAQEAK